MFDNIDMYDILDQQKLLPEEYKVANKLRGYSFQTKDTPNQSMSTYKVDTTYKLYVLKVDGVYEERTGEKNDSFFDNFPIFRETSREWVRDSFTGEIRFYDSYNHPEYSSDDDFNARTPEEWPYVNRFKLGWVEFTAQFVDGIFLNVKLDKHDLPQKLTDEEVATTRQEIIERWQKNEKQKIARRKSHPTNEQKLIDSIDNAIQNILVISDEVDYGRIINQVQELINKYREQHDQYHRP